jgi:hypothetical protein
MIVVITKFQVVSNFLILRLYGIIFSDFFKFLFSKHFCNGISNVCIEISNGLYSTTFIVPLDSEYKVDLKILY